MMEIDDFISEDISSHFDDDVRPQVLETTALGAALLAGLGVGVYATAEETAQLWKRDLIFEPKMTAERRGELLAGWHRAVERSLGWARPAD